jgi:hypothetical protein
VPERKNLAVPENFIPSPEEKKVLFKIGQENKP